MGEQNMIANRYMVVQSIGSGGMADVFLAIDTILNREVAVKVLRGDSGKDPVSLLRFQREASAVSKLNHPNVVEVYDIGESDGRSYIVMEYVRGKTLKQLIRQRGALEKEEAVAIMKQLVAAVKHAHENNIIHRDIKPQNVLVKDDGTVKITDFGIALAHDAVQLTQADSVLGSAHYIAPETTRGEVATVQIDIYALGIVFYELLTGSVPFTGDNPVQIAMKHMREDIPSVREFNPTIPQSVENVIIRATAKNRVHRYESAKDMLFDLDMCLMKEFANVEKVVFPDEDENGSGTLVFDQTQKQKTPDLNNQKIIKDEQEEIALKKTNRKITAIITIVILLIAGGTLGVYFSGVIPGFGPEQYADVPNLEGLSLEKAAEILEEYGLELSDDVASEVTDDMPEGRIVSQKPSADSRVAKGAKVKVTISSGNFFLIENYVGMKLSAVEGLLQNNNINVLVEEYETDEADEGVIIQQSLLEPGDKVKPGVSKNIKFTVAKAAAKKVPNYVGEKIEDAKSELEALGFSVTLKKIEPEVDDDGTTIEVDENRKGVVIEQSPKAGTTYKESEDNTITLSYYE